MNCKTHENLIAKNQCPICLVEALQSMQKAWIQDKPRSMHDLKIDMDAANEQANQALKEQ